MKKALILTCLTIGLITLETSQASAFYCEARASTGSWGWGRSQSPDRARRIALQECAVRTPRRAVCRITYCDRRR